MEGLETVKNLIREGDWMVKLELKGANLTVPILRAHQKFLRFVWRKKIFQFSCLPFGLSSAPRLFTKVLKAVVAFFRERGIRLVIYLDDILIWNGKEEKLKTDVVFVTKVLQSLGFLINWEKTVSTPSQSLEYLGVVIDSNKLFFHLPQDKISKIKSRCSSILSKPWVPLRDLASVLGNLVWAISCRLAGRFGGNLSTKCELSVEAKEDLTWWVSFLDLVNGKSFSSLDPDITIYSDASLSGWGACSNGVTTRGPWTSVDQSCHINELELLGAFYAIQSLLYK